MSNASSAGLLKTTLELSSAIKSLRFPSARRSLAAIGLVLFAQGALAAPFNYVADFSGCTIGTATYSGCISVIDVSLPGNQVVATIPQAVAATSTTAATPGIGAGPLGVAINPAGTRVYVVNYSDSTDSTTNGTVSVIDSNQSSPTLNQVIASITVGVKPELVAVSPNGAMAYVTNSVSNSVSVINTTTNTQTTTISVGGVPVGVAFTPDGSKAYVTLADKSRVAIIDTASSTASSTTIPLSVSNPIGIVVNSAGTFAYVADFGQAEAAPAQVGAVSVINLATGAEVAAIPVGFGPIGIAISPDGSRVYVSNYVDGTVSVIDTATNTQTALVAVGLGPLGITVDTTGTYAYVNNANSDSVSIIDLSANVARAGAITVGTAPNYSAITSSASLSVNLDQHGLTGAWYNPSTSGQGFYVDALPDVNGAGNGVLSAGWFTYDVTAAGGQRWYWLQGDVTSTNPVANLTIYTGAGGNFNAGPVVASVAVGQASLQFTDCTHGALKHSFSDGSNRQGFIGLVRLTGNTTCTSRGDSGNAGNYLLSGSWYNSSTSGQGLVLNVDPAMTASPLSGGWFTYAPNGQQIGGGASQRWYAIQSNQAAQGNSYSAAIYEGSGGAFVNPTSTVTTTAVGTANAVFTSCTAMSLTYNFSAGTNKGLSGTVNLARLGPAPAGCGQ
jgi:YVTN family beta-propeller protein